MQRFVLVTRLSGMEGSFLWRSRRHLHGESSTSEPHVPLFKRDLIAHFAQILLVRKRNLLSVLHTRYMSQDHLNLAFDAVLGVRVIKCTSLLTVIKE